MASITISCDGSEQKYALENASVTLGRGLESDIRLKDIKASRRHCQIAKTPQGYQLIDLSSGNGTFINGVQVKQQPLNPGDKIQIGSTTITFHEGAPAAAKAAPAAKPAAAASAAAGKTSQSKVATAQLPVAATRKITARAEAVKPTTQSVKKPGTQAIAKAQTQASPKTGTGAMKKITQRPGGTSRSMSKASATQKFHAEARKGKSNPVAMILVGIGVIFVLIVGFIMFSGGGGDQNVVVAEKFAKVRDAAALAHSERRYDDAVRLYKDAIKEVEGREAYKGDVVTLKQNIKEIEQAKKDMAAASGRFEAFRKKFDEMKAEQARDLLIEGRELREAVKDFNFDWFKELKLIIERIEKVLDTEAATAKRQDFQVIRNEIETSHKLGAAEPDYAGALKAWQQYVAQPSADKTKTDAEVQKINIKAKGEFVRLKGRAERNTDKAAAAAELEKHLPRFELTESAADLKKLLEELKAK